MLNISALTQTKRAVIPKKSSSKRFITAILKQGESLNGTFSDASSVGIQIVVDNNALNLKWKNISQIFFTDSVSNNSVNKNNSKIKNNPAVENALKSLRKIAAATEVGINFQEYNRRVIDVKAEIEEFLPKIDNSYIKSEIESSMKNYQIAVTYWDIYITSRESQRVTEWTFENELKDYWKKARKHLENAIRGEPER
jgi:hypothetical protein